MSDTMKHDTAEDSHCEDCDGAGEICGVCHELPGNCDCEVESFEDCETCEGQGVIDHVCDDSCEQD